MKKLFKVEIICFICIIFLLSNLDAFANQTSYKRNQLRTSKFEPGDAIRISIIEVLQSSDRRGSFDFNINNDYAIATDGTILMPLIGKLKVTGHDEQSLIKVLTENYKQYFKEPYITVIPLMRLTLMGSFIKPGAYRINPNSSLWEFIEMAEGPTSECDLNSLSVVRGGKVVIDNLLHSFEQGYSLEDIGVQSGDQIIAKDKSTIGIRDILNWTQFGLTLIILYLRIDEMNSK